MKEGKSERVKVKTVINPKYEPLREWILSIPAHFATQGEVIYDARNQIRMFTTPDGTKVCVKRFHAPRFLNKYIYLYLRDSKARRAYQNGLYLIAHHVGTPDPIAYIEEYSGVGLGYSYLITRLSALKHLHREFTQAYTPALDATIRPLARFAAHMHEEGILHLDFSPGNILWDQINGTYQFEIIDINRMAFGRVSMKAGCRSLRRLCARSSFFDEFADEYAKARHLDPDQCRHWIHYYRNRFWHNGRKARYQYD